MFSGSLTGPFALLCSKREKVYKRVYARVYTHTYVCACVCVSLILSLPSVCGLVFLSREELER